MFTMFSSLSRQLYWLTVWPWLVLSTEYLDYLVHRFLVVTVLHWKRISSDRWELCCALLCQRSHSLLYPSYHNSWPGTLCSRLTTANLRTDDEGGSMSQVNYYSINSNICIIYLYLTSQVKNLVWTNWNTIVMFPNKSILS